MQEDHPVVRRLTITSGQLAAKFGISEPTLRKRLPKLYAEGFPRRLPGGAVWSEPAVDRWFATAGMPAQIEPVKLELIAEATAELMQEYAA